MERVVNKARGHQAAAEWDIRQQQAMTVQERWRAAKLLRDRVFGTKCKDIRECHRKG